MLHMVVARVLLPIGVVVLVVLPSVCTTPSPQGLLQMVSAFNDVSLFLMLSTQPRPDAEISSVSALGAYNNHTSSTNFLINALLWKLDSPGTRRTQPMPALLTQLASGYSLGNRHLIMRIELLSSQSVYFLYDLCARRVKPKKKYCATLVISGI